MCRSTYVYLWQLRSVTRVLSAKDAKTVVHAFITSPRVLTTVTRCCSASLTVCFGVFRPYKTLQHMMSLVTGTRRREHITPVLRQLHWLLVPQRIEFKLAVLAYKAMNGLSPQYLADDCQLTCTSTAGRRRLRSSNVVTCEVPRTRTSLGDRSFTVAGPRLWNNLPLHLRDSEHTFLEFGRLLKTHLFC